MAKRPALPLAELRRRYDALGAIEDMAFERTSIGRCATWAGFLQAGERYSAAIRSASISEHELAHNPALIELILEAWPGPALPPTEWPRLEGMR
ncbi:MAG TPA: hypothetical protein DCY89_05835 [Gammaproteobacteria bacterium]|nr:hypothetical protein [Gammaproteobacteria bacterium]